MGIYTDYGRFQKAREFKNYCNSGAGIWFAFSMGSPRWDEIIHKNLNGSEDTTDILNVPPSAPAAYTPLYRWFASYKGDDLQVQEFSLLDRSFCDSYNPSNTIDGYTEGTWPTNLVLKNNEDILPPINDKFSPSIITLNEDFVSSNTPFVDSAGTIDNQTKEHTWKSDYTTVEKKFYPTPSLPAFPVSYQTDWDTIIAKAKNKLVGINEDLYLFYQNNARGNDSWNEPTDSSKFESWSYMYHISQTVETKESASSSEATVVTNSDPNARPLGLYSFIKGVAKFVEPVSEEMAQDSSLSTFKYGSHFWKIVPDSEINENNLPHHILLTVSVFPNELSSSSIVERYLPVRQVSVFKFPDCILDQIPELKQENPTRRYQVLKRDRFRIFRSGDSNIPTIPDIDSSTSQIRDWDNGRQVYLPFYFDDPDFTENIYLNPNPPNKEEGGQEVVRLRGTIEMLINDFMTARKRDVQQTDRYGYIIGF